MTRLPRITAKRLIKALEKTGYIKHHQVGSHIVFKSFDQSKRVVVPYHQGKIIKPKTLKSILKDAELTLDEFTKLL